MSNKITEETALAGGIEALLLRIDQLTRENEQLREYRLDDIQKAALRWLTVGPIFRDPVDLHYSETMVNEWHEARRRAMDVLFKLINAR